MKLNRGHRYLGMLALGLIIVTGAHWIPEPADMPVEMLGLVLSGYGLGASLKYFS
jgi:hypothetical protein